MSIERLCVVTLFLCELNSCQLLYFMIDECGAGIIVASKLCLYNYYYSESIMWSLVAGEGGAASVQLKAALQFEECPC